MDIRRLEAADWEAYRTIRIEALEVAPEAFGSDAAAARLMSREEWLGRVAPRPGSFVLGAFDAGRIVGTAGFAREDRLKTRHKGNVWGVFVSPSFRGRGLGKELMVKLIDEARAMAGLEQILLGVVADNAPARELYLSLGFQTWGTEPRALRVGERYLDEDYMVLFLQGI